MHSSDDSHPSQLSRNVRSHLELHTTPVAYSATTTLCHCIGEASMPTSPPYEGAFAPLRWRLPMVRFRQPCLAQKQCYFEGELQVSLRASLPMCLCRLKAVRVRCTMQTLDRDGNGLGFCLRCQRIPDQLHLC
jgi:hypothetical protein